MKDMTTTRQQPIRESDTALVQWHLGMEASLGYSYYTVVNFCMEMEFAMATEFESREPVLPFGHKGQRS